jgi:hypothetical protein
MTTTEIADRLLRYKPRGIPENEWELARDAAGEAVVECKVETAETARVLLGRLAQFLIWHPGWDRQSSPDLKVLLAVNFIETYCANPSTPPTERPYLRRVARAIGAMPPRDSIKRSPKRLAARPFWTSAIDLGPFIGLAAAYQSLGNGLPSVAFGGFLGQQLVAAWNLDQLVASTASAPSEPLDTMADVVRAAVNLRSAPDVEPTGVRVIQNTKAKSDQAKAVKPQSRTAVVKAAKATRALRTAATEVIAAGMRPEPILGDLPEVSPLVAEAIAAFRPNLFTDSQWELVADATRQLATAYDPASVNWVQTQMGAIARFCRWAVARPARGSSIEPLRPAELLVEGLVEEYVAGPLATAPDGTQTTVRSILRRALRRLAPDLAPRVITLPPMQPPYTPYECASWVRLARNQPTATFRRGMSAIIALGLGAGLAPGEQRAITPDSIFESALPDGVTGLFVRVGGARSRTVVVRAQYEELLREALALHRKAGRRSSDPLYGLSKTRRNVTGRVTQRAKTALGTGVDLDPARLRSTWLVACMSADIPLGALLRASGLRSARTLVDLVKYCPEPDEAAVAAILRTVQERESSVTL